jgi:amino acid adenylation domain-containing protein
MSVTPESTADLSPEEKRALLAKLLEQKRGVRRAFPLSFAQARLWILDRFQPGTPTYNLPLALRLPGSIDVDMLERSLNEIARRHEALRTTFEIADGQPSQIVAPSIELKVYVVDKRAEPNESREVEVGRIVFEECSYSFDLAHGPLVRATLLKVADNDNLLIVVIHHIISDGWSLGLFYSELSTLYTAFSAGLPSPLPDLPIQYADFARWQAEWMRGEVLEQHLAYWRTQLAGISPVLDLPADRPRPPAQSHRGAQYTFLLERRVCDGLNALSRREGVTLFMTLLAAFKTLLHRYTGQTDIVVGSPIAGRTRVELENLIGFFVNTLVLRTDLSNDPTFRELLGRVREVTLGAYAHQDMPFEKLVEELQPARDLSRNPLFQVMFVLQNLATPERTSRGAANPVPQVPPVANGTAKFDLTLSVAETGNGGAQGFLEYNTDLFDEATVVRMMERFQILLSGITDDPNRRLSRLPIIGELERCELAERQGEPRARGLPVQTVCELVAAHAERAPDATALIADESEISYHELNCRADRFARRLRAFGAGPGTLVGICAERSVESVIALLGILKVGGAYVPLDPTAPTSRMALILEDAGVSLVVTEERHAARLPDVAAQVLYLDRSREELTHESAEELAANVSAEKLGVNVGADDLACVLYQSSPKGRPEGVMLMNRALCRTALAPELSIITMDRIAQTSDFSEVAACFEIFGALAAGARLVLVPSRPQVAPRKLASLLRDQQITVMFAPAFLLERLAREFPWALRTLRLLLCDERPATRKRLCEVLDAEVLQRVYGFYGMQETGGPCALRPLRTQTVGASVAPLGDTVDGARLYLLDAHLKPVPQDVLGEIYISADALARGYHGRPERTASLFVPDGLSATPGARLYRTGDWARRLPGGELEYRGRHDGRIVMRGMRVEPREVEAELLGHDGVLEAAVVTRDNIGAREPRLVAFVVSAEGQIVTENELRVFLRDRLPEAMIPSTFTTLGALPRDARGEVDRHALAAAADAGDTSGGAAPPYEAPRNDVETALARIWAQTFGIEQVGIHDSFFRLGGHSLLATQMVARVSDAFRVDLPLGRLFETPTIAELSKVVEQLVQAGTKATAPPIVRMAREAVTLPVDPGSSLSR